MASAPTLFLREQSPEHPPSSRSYVYQRMDFDEGMTTLYTDLREEGALLGRGILTFDMKDLVPFLASFGLDAERPEQAAPR